MSPPNYENIRVFQHRDNQKKLQTKPRKPNFINLNLDFQTDYIEVLNKKLDFENMQDTKTPRLFHMRSEDNKMEYHNMQLTKILIKCQDCDFEYRLSKTNIDKHMRLKKKLKVEPAKLHMQEYKSHKMIVHQTFEQYRPFQKYPN